MNKVSVTAQFCIFGAVFMIGLLAASSCNYILATFELTERTRDLIMSVVQSLFAFCLPSFIVARLEKKGMIGTLSLNRVPTLTSILGVLMAYAVGFAMLNQIVDWNDSMTLPDSMQEIEETMRSLEDSARQTATTLMTTDTVGGLLVNILVIGIITGFSEEIFFRAGLQRLLSKALPQNWSVWVAAIIFSVLHFQFYGFVPRMLLGAFSGFLYVWTGSIWVAVFAHALNNSICVVLDWMYSQGIINVNPEFIGVTDHGFPIYAAISALLFFIFIRYRKLIFNKSKSLSK